MLLFFWPFSVRHKVHAFNFFESTSIKAAKFGNSAENNWQPYIQSISHYTQIYMYYSSTTHSLCLITYRTVNNSSVRTDLCFSHQLITLTCVWTLRNTIHVVLTTIIGTVRRNCNLQLHNDNNIFFINFFFSINYIWVIWY